MKKTLVLIRHAKAADPEVDQRDFDRPLTERGKNNAVDMGRVLKQAGLQPDCILASPARRTTQTAKRIADATGFPIDAITWIERMYHASASTLEAEVAGLPDDVGTVFVVGHNPGITEFAGDIDPVFRIEHMPTCAVVAATIELKEWSQFLAAGKKIFLFKHP